MGGITHRASLLFTIFVEVTEEGNLVGRCLEIPKAVGTGKTLQELRRNIAKIISLIQGSMSEEKEVVTPLSNICIKDSVITSQCLPAAGLPAEQHSK